MPKCFFYVRNSKITNPKVVMALFEPLKDGKYTLEVTRESKRSGPQNAYYHGCVLPLVLEGLQDAGFADIKDLEDAKAVTKALFLKEKVINPETGELVTETVKDTSKLSTVEFMLFIDQIVMWAASYLGVTIPAPNSQAEIEY